MINKTHRAFTLIEFILVIALTSIISALSIPFYTRFLTQANLANTVNELIGSLRKAQTYSMMGRQNSVWGVNYSADKITLFKGSTFGQDHTFDEVFDINPNITITGFTEINFSRITGIPNTTAMITVSGNNDSKTITINSQGIVSN